MSERISATCMLMGLVVFESRETDVLGSQSQMSWQAGNLTLDSDGRYCYMHP